MYTFLQKKNNAESTLSSGITSATTSVIVASASSFPATGTFVCTIWNKATYPDPSLDPSMEIVHVTGISGSVFTIVRAQESTTAKSHNTGDAIESLLTLGQLLEYETTINTVLGGTANEVPFYNNLGVYTTNANFTIDNNQALTAYALSAKGAYYGSPANPIALGTSNNHLYSAIYDDGNNNGTLRIFAQSPGNYWNFLQTDASGNWVSRMTMGDPIDGTITYSAYKWAGNNGPPCFILGGGGTGFGDSWMRITTGNLGLGDGSPMQMTFSNGGIQINPNSYNPGSTPILQINDSNGNIGFQVNCTDGVGDYVQTLNNVLDDGSGNQVIGGEITAASFVIPSGSPSAFLKANGGTDTTQYLPYSNKGTITLVSGTKALTLSGLTSSNLAFVTLVTPGGTLGNHYKAVCTTNTLTVTAITLTGSTVTTDTSTLNYLII